MKIKKWGGENAAEFIKSPQNVVDDYKKGFKQAIVVSAIRSEKFNTTDNLISLGKQLSSVEIDKASILYTIETIKDFHLEILDTKLSGNNDEIKNSVIDIFDTFSLDIDYWINREDKIYPSEKNDYLINTKEGYLSIIGFGEILSSKIQKLLLNNLGIEGLDAEVLNMQSLTSGINEKDGEGEIFKKLSKEIASRVFEIFKQNKIPVIQGYIPGFKKGIENAIGRGYSDATASMVAVGLSEQGEDIVLEIQKSVLGILSADPRIINDGTKLIKNIDYITAKEITGARGAQAKLLHSQVLRKELQDAGINIKLFDPFSKSEGTLISKNKNNATTGVEYIGGRKNIIVFTVSSGNMSGTGILALVFDIVKNYTPVDIIGTSETEITFTISLSLSSAVLEKMTSEIKEVLDIKENNDIDFVEYKKYKALVYCIGQNMKKGYSILGKAATALGKGNIDIELVSQGRLQRAFVFCLDELRMEDAIQLLHKELIK